MRVSSIKGLLKPGFRRVVLAVLLLDLLVFTLIGLVLSWNLDHERAKATLVADNLGRVLEENLARFIDKIDLTLLAVADEVSRQERGGGINRAELEAFMARHDARLPEALGLRVVGADGMIEYAVSNIGANVRISIADREHFTRPRDNPQTGPFISKPIIGRLNPQPMIVLARRRTDHDGAFAGTIHVAVSVASLSAMFSTIDIGPLGSVGLWDDGPTLLARFARVPAPTSGVSTPSPTLKQLVAANAPPTPYSTLSGVDGLERVFFYRRVGPWPLYLVVGVSPQDYLAGWRREAAYLVGLGLVFLLASMAASLIIQRAMMAMERARAEAEKARRHSELVLASVGDGICGVDLDGRVTFINDAARRMLNWSDETGAGTELHASTHHHHADGTPYPVEECPIRQVLNGNAPSQIVRIQDEVYWRGDGSSFPVEYTVSAIVEDGRTVGAVNVFRDVSERRAAEAAMARSLATTEALASCLNQSLGDLSLNAILDFALGELLDLPWLKLQARGSVFLLDGGRTLHMAASRNLPAPICSSCSTVPVGRCLCGKAAACAEVVFADCLDARHEVGYEAMTEHGHYCIPIKAAGQVLGVLNTYVAHHHRRDPEEERFLRMYADTLAGIIKRKRAEKTLHDSKELARTLMNATIDAAALLDRDGAILAANEAFAARFATAADALAGRAVFDLDPPLLTSRQFEEVLQTGAPLHTHDDRKGQSLDNRIYPVTDGDGAVTWVAVFSRDVTDQRDAARAVEKAMADLESSNRDLEQFAYVASHDLRQPLRMIGSYLGLIQRRLGDDLPPDIQDFIGFAVGGARRMDALILGLLEYSRASHNVIVHEPVALDEVLDDTLGDLVLAIDEAGAEIVRPKTPAVAMGGRVELTRLFQNLIGNAIKYRSPERPPRVEITWTAQNGDWQVRIADNGLGIPAEDRDRAFGIFQRLVSSDAVEGTGIGLAVCRKIVEHHGGHIWIESNAGRGSVFCFTLKSGSGLRTQVTEG
jgi:PAS domain S-box-containing protein